MTKQLADLIGTLTKALRSGSVPNLKKSSYKSYSTGRRMSLVFEFWLSATTKNEKSTVAISSVKGSVTISQALSAGA